MDVEEFARHVRPASARSRMAPFLEQLLKLREAGYTLAQLQDFLGRNGVGVSVAGVSAYLIRRAPSPAQRPQVAAPGPSPVLPRPGVSSTASAGLQDLLRNPPSDLDSLTRQGRRMKPK